MPLSAKRKKRGKPAAAKKPNKTSMSFFQKPNLAEEIKKEAPTEPPKVVAEPECVEPAKKKFKQSYEGPNKVKELVMSDGKFCLNDQSLVQIIDIEVFSPHETFPIEKFHDPTAIHFFKNNPEA